MKPQRECWVHETVCANSTSFYFSLALRRPKKNKTKILEKEGISLSYSEVTIWLRVTDRSRKTLSRFPVVVSSWIFSPKSCFLFPPTSAPFSFFSSTMHSICRTGLGVVLPTVLFPVHPFLLCSTQRPTAKCPFSLSLLPFHPAPHFGCP